ncbi:MAG TPA: diacylglycerol kinase family protein [Ktedonobacteraceae bacterium]|nr:diacylglycerol kinase family protein [Ktedonobacteraceae bacterium]
MQCKKACLVINPRAGENIAKITDVLAVLAAAGWETDIVLKKYGGQTMELAAEAAEKGYDLVVGYGGDGTLNQVVNGVMNKKGQHNIVGLIPGGTANVWAGEVGIPGDPVKAALTLVNSDSRKVDVGHVELASLTFPDTTQENGQQSSDHPTNEKGQRRKVKPTKKARHHFLLMAGLGIDAAVMGHVSKPMKYKIGPLAVGLSAVKELPAQHPFPIEIRAEGAGRKDEVLWKGEAIQVVIGNTRKYADVVQMTPNAYIDDGVLDVTVITAGNPISTMQQITSLLLRRKPDNMTTENFYGSHLTMSVPASIDLQLDGSAVKLKDYLSKADRKALEQSDAEQVMITYRFDAMPKALRIAIPNSYDDELFENARQETSGSQEQHEEETQAKEEHVSHRDEKRSAEEQEKDLEQVKMFLENGRKVKIIGASANPEKKHSYIVAGQVTKESTGEAKPVAVCIDDNTTIIKRTGEHETPAVVRELQEGGDMVVEGKKSKRGVIRASRVVVI